MKKVKFVFRKFSSSFSVKIENLEELSVAQIQQIQRFVQDRNGIFDFEKYEFVIQKKLEYEEFKKLLEFCHIEAITTEKLKELKSYHRVSFGKYKGMFYKDIPSSYLLWLQSNYYGSDREVLEREIKARGI